ncbi:hypothetical protein HDV06_002255 [Boothiomyces sp. JEL0866]|nr:hypothetical protein HDV06_002255 [Boothiomyces sp. JEL0866]
MDALRNQYLNSLKELTFNSKPIITNLTIIAEENLSNAPVIVQAIEQQISNVQPAYVIPLLYLMDSILKNVGKGYIAAFQKNLVRVFAGAYAKVNDADKARFQRTLQTWKATPGGYLFPSHVIAGIERSINVANLPPVGYVMNNVQRPPAPVRPAAPQPVLNQAQVQQRLSSLLGQKKALLVVQPNDLQLGKDVDVLAKLLQVVQTANLDPSTLASINSKINEIAPAVQNAPPVHSVIPSVPHPKFQPPQSTGFPISNLQIGSSLGISGPIGLGNNPVPSLGANGIGLHNLGPAAGINGLTAVSEGFMGQSTAPNSSGLGILPNSFNPSLLASISTTSLNGLFSTFNSSALLSIANSDQKVPVIQLTQSDITKPIKKHYNILYDNIELQCKQCALRFPGENGKEELTAHLDWHFRKNRRKHEKKATSSRGWYLTEPEWVIEQPIEPTENQVAPVFFDLPKEQETEELSCIPTSDPINKCDICKETIEKFFDDDNDGWMLRGAVKVNDSYYHQTCYKDRQDTPSLAKRTLENDDMEPSKKIRVQ